MHQVEDLRLDSDIECRRRFVGNQDVRLACQGHGNHYALAHAARQLVGIVVGPRLGIGNADRFEHLDGSFVGTGLFHALVQQECFADLPADCEHGIERAHRFLKDHGDIAAAHFLHGLVGQAGQFPSVQFDRAGQDFAEGRQQLENGQRGQRFAAAAFASKGQGLALVEGEADILNHSHKAVIGIEADAEIVDLQRWRSSSRHHSRLHSSIQFVLLSRCPVGRAPFSQCGKIYEFGRQKRGSTGSSSE